ncbi:MAG: hypothetical protein JRJ58_23610 [Deltaproteobacteria bacterium]|nr:hypothetical protein [Deltaproteobacteria bacterium]
MIRRNRIALLMSLLGIASGTLGGTCVVIEEGPPGDNMEEMEEQEEEVSY